MELLGKEATDRVTGFKGVVTGYVVYLTDCNQCLVTAKAKKNDCPKAMWIDQQRLTFGKKKPLHWIILKHPDLMYQLLLDN